MSDQNTTVPGQNPALMELTAEIVSAFVAKNSVPAAELPGFIASTYAALGELGKAPAEAVAPAKQEPAVPIRKSVTDDYIISLEDGRKFKSMKRYLTGLGMTPSEYRAKWGLPPDYPMVAPNYAKARSTLAKSIGLGSIRRNNASAPAPAHQVEAAAPAPKRSRAKKAA